jgi:hypothetical protein
VIKNYEELKKYFSRIDFDNLKDNKEFHNEMVLSHKNGELTTSAKKMLDNYTNEVFENWYENNGENINIEKNELLKGGRKDVFKFWKEFKYKEYNDYKPFFGEVFKRSLSKFIRNESR